MDRRRCSSSDVTDVTALQAAIKSAADAHGPITTLVNNAAWDNRRAIEGFTPDEWDGMVNVNLRPHFFTAQAIAAGMKEAGGGSIINFSSIAFRIAGEGYPCYATAKAAIVGLTSCLARELGGDRIRQFRFAWLGVDPAANGSLGNGRRAQGFSCSTMHSGTFARKGHRRQRALSCLKHQPHDDRPIVGDRWRRCLSRLIHCIAWRGWGRLATVEPALPTGF